MATNQNVNASEDQARELVEQSREQNWAGKGFLRNLFLGDLRVDWLDPWPETPFSPEFQVFYRKLEAFFIEKVDSAKIDATGEYGDDVLKGLAELGTFGMKIGKKYGGLGFNNVEYCKALELIGRYDGNCVALISAHQSIGVPSPLKLFGSEEQKAKYLPRCARGEVSAFALTEPDVGSDPARVGTQCVKQADGSWVITGEKLWCSNGTIAGMYVVMARNPADNKITAFVVERDTPGVEVAYRCRFMGLRALANGVIRFTNVRVPAENIIFKEGSGLKVALDDPEHRPPVHPGRHASAPAKAMLEEMPPVGERARPVGRSHRQARGHRAQARRPRRHRVRPWRRSEQIATELSPSATATTSASRRLGRQGVGAPSAAGPLIDEGMQIKGGRGYETEASLAGRGERPFPGSSARCATAASTASSRARPRSCT
jgi:hypothetical protein